MAEALTPDAETVPALLTLRAETDRAREAIVTECAAITYAELDDACRALAARLVAAGVTKGDRVGLLAPNSIEWAVTAYAVLRIGAVLVGLSTLLRPPELLAQLTTAEVTHLVVVREFRNRHYLDELEQAAPGLQRTLTAGSAHATVPSLRAVWPLDDLPLLSAPPAQVRALEASVQADDDLSILFTSGSTGSPKGVIHTHGAGIRATTAGLEARCVHPGERLYVQSPFFWMGGFATGFMTALVAGATLVTQSKPEPASTLALLQRARVTLYRDWADQAARLVAHPDFPRTDLSSLGDGSLPVLLPPERRPAPGSRANTMGMTESFGPYSGARLDVDLPPDKFGSCGRPFAGVEVRIADPDSDDELLPGEEGRICLRGPNLLRGMCGIPRSSLFTADGFYRTGDRGRLDADGYLWFGGRLDDMFKVRGATVFPSEVEASLRALDEVREAHVVGLPGDDGRTEVGALVVTDASIAELHAALRDRMSAFKVPTRWLVTSDRATVPMLVTGKLDKPALRTLLVERGIDLRS